MNLESLRHVSQKIAKNTESIILEQLNELVKRGAIVVEQGEVLLTREADSNEIKVSQKIALKLKDQEYIEKLEKINSKLQETINELRGTR